MQFPYTPKYLYHRHGGKITHIRCIAHFEDKRTPKAKRSRDYWYFICRVEWSDKTVSTEAEVPPNLFSYDSDNEVASNAEINELLGEMNDYLIVNGNWNEDKGWCANRGAKLG